jgi:S1-C subfamily serine protease
MRMQALGVGRTVWPVALLLVSGQLALADEPKPGAVEAKAASTEARAGSVQSKSGSASAAESGMPMLKIRRRTLESLGTDPPLALEVNAGVIPRAAWRAELARGIGFFLRQVRTEPALARGRFVGWRVLGLFAGRTDVNVLVLRPGDTVMRVNGQSVERPEDFKLVWDSLATALELVLDIQRGGRSSKLHYTIVN